MKSIIFILFFASTTFADEPYKVIGRGVVDKRTGERLQIACVGESLPDSSERSCDRLQFLLTDNGVSILSGSVLVLKQGKSQDDVRRQMKDFLKDKGLLNNLRNTRKFSYTRELIGLFTHTRSRTMTQDYNTHGLILAGVGIPAYYYLLAPLATNIPNGIALGLTIPVVVDILLLPITSILDVRQKAAIYGFKARSIEALQDSARYSWQFKPQKIKTKIFQRLKTQLRENQ